MDSNIRRFVACPDFNNLKQQKLKYIDALTYITIRSFHDDGKGYAYPPQPEIQKLSGLGITTVKQSVKRLETADFFYKKQSLGKGTSNRYYFGNLPRFERIPYGLFSADELKPNEKALLVCLRQFFNHDRLGCLYSIPTLAIHLGLTYNTIYPLWKSLLSKGYVSEQTKIDKTGKILYKALYFTSKLNWVYKYGVQTEKVTPLRIQVK